MTSHHNYALICPDCLVALTAVPGKYICERCGYELAGLSVSTHVPCPLCSQGLLAIRNRKGDKIPCPMCVGRGYVEKDRKDDAMYALLRLLIKRTL